LTDQRGREKCNGGTRERERSSRQTRPKKGSALLRREEDNQEQKRLFTRIDREKKNGGKKMQE